MTVRKPRRAVFAELLLIASPSAMTARHDGVSLSITFDCAADLYAWLDAAGLNTPGLLTCDHTVTDDVNGLTFRSVSAYPSWHGWEIYAAARDEVSASSLDDATITAFGECLYCAPGGLNPCTPPDALTGREATR